MRYISTTPLVTITDTNRGVWGFRLPKIMSPLTVSIIFMSSSKTVSHNKIVLT